MVKCPECEEEFDSERGMNIHKSRVHKETEEKKESKKQDEQEKWYKKWERELVLITLISLTAIAILAVSLVPVNEVIGEENDFENNETKEMDLNETDENDSYEDLYRPRNNTLYLICNFENETVAEEYCRYNHAVATSFTRQEGIDYRRYDISSENAMDIMRGIGFGKYPLWVYNTEETPEGEYCWGIGSVEQTPLYRFISECEEVGKYIP